MVLPLIFVSTSKRKQNWLNTPGRSFTIIRNSIYIIEHYETLLGTYTSSDSNYSIFTLNDLARKEVFHSKTFGWTLRNSKFAQAVQCFTTPKALQNLRNKGQPFQLCWITWWRYIRKFVGHDLPTRKSGWASYRNRSPWRYVAIELRIMRSRTLQSMRVRLIGKCFWNCLEDSASHQGWHLFSRNFWGDPQAVLI